MPLGTETVVLATIYLALQAGNPVPNTAPDVRLERRARRAEVQRIKHAKPKRQKQFRPRIKKPVKQPFPKNSRRSR